MAKLCNEMIEDKKTGRWRKCRNFAKYGNYCLTHRRRASSRSRRSRSRSRSRSSSVYPSYRPYRVKYVPYYNDVFGEYSPSHYVVGKKASPLRFVEKTPCQRKGSKNSCESSGCYWTGASCMTK